MYKRAYYWRNKKMMPPAGTEGINKTGNQEQKDNNMIVIPLDFVNQMMAWVVVGKMPPIKFARSCA